MDTSEVLKRIGIPRSKLYYLELKGYIRPRHIPRGDQELREYSEEDLARIHLIWVYLQKGYKLKAAYRKAVARLKSLNR